MQVNNIIGKEIQNRLKQDIDTASGREIFLVARLEPESGRVVDYNVLARGNRNMAPAIVSDLGPGTMVIHNHPSGDLTPSAVDIRLASRIGERGIGFAIINNQVTDIYVVVEPRVPEEEKKLRAPKIIEYFEPESELAGKLHNYEYREEQLAVVKEVIENFNHHSSSFIEAGTGTGKSLAYLIPALYWSHENNTPVIISTNTINLQEQLIKKDLILLKKVIPFSFKAVLVKGRGNYVCRRKVKTLSKGIKKEDNLDEEKMKEINRIKEWIQNTETGSRTDINFYIKNDIWDLVASESELCLKTRCPYFDKCFFMNARKEIHSADILIVNHHLLLSDASLKQENSGVLPEFKHLIIDEAHNFADVATYQLGIPFNYRMLKKFLDRLNDGNFALVPQLHNSIRELEIERKTTYFRLLDRDIIPLSKSINESGAAYFQRLDDFFPANDKYKVRLQENVREKDGWQSVESSRETLTGYLENLGLKLSDFYNTLMQETDDILFQMEEQIMSLEMAINNCGEIVRAINFNHQLENKDYVFWLERINGKVHQRNAPLIIAERLRELVWNKMDTSILTSATLTVRKRFEFFQEILGLQESRVLRISSPFDYSRQSRLMIIRDIPPPNSPHFLSEIEDNFLQMLLNFGGRTMVLFTSYRMLNSCLRRCETKLNSAGITVLAQGKYPRHYIIENFKNNQSRIIFGTVSFWEGVDIRGDDLKYLVIMKLPFPVPSEPVAAARKNVLRQEGKNPFYHYSLPRAVIRFKQGFGRLIRSRSDEGMVISLDNRLLEKSYGQVFLDSLPEGCPVEQIEFNTIAGGL